MSFEFPKRVHVVGACGTLMGAFCRLLQKQGVQVSGSDQNVYPPMSDILRDAGVALSEGYRAENIPGDVDLVVIGNVIRKDNPEARAAIDGGHKYTSLPEFMEKYLLHESHNILLSGTHGKTTTTSIMSFVLRECGLDPSYFVGGVCPDLEEAFFLSSDAKGKFVLEADEYDTAFWDKVPKFNHYPPRDVVLTSVEYDHADIYPSMQSVIDVFNALVARIPKDGRLIACVDYPIVEKVIKEASCKVITYGGHAVTRADFYPERLRSEGEFTCFDVISNGEKVDELKIRLAGKHNVMNALAVWIECRELGIESSKVNEALSRFRGVKRRLELRGEPRGIKVIDDFAHHPTAVGETIDALRLKFPERKITIVFEPRSATSRRAVFQKDYVKALKRADVVFVAEPYDQSLIDKADRFSTERLIGDLVRKGVTAESFSSKSDDDLGRVQTLISEGSTEGDVVAVLSNGGFDGFIPKLLSALEK